MNKSDSEYSEHIYNIETEKVEEHHYIVYDDAYKKQLELGEIRRSLYNTIVDLYGKLLDVREFERRYHKVSYAYGIELEAGRLTQEIIDKFHELGKLGDDMVAILRFKNVFKKFEEEVVTCIEKYDGIKRSYDEGKTNQVRQLT